VIGVLQPCAYVHIYLSVREINHINNNSSARTGISTATRIQTRGRKHAFLTLAERSGRESILSSPRGVPATARSLPSQKHFQDTTRQNLHWGRQCRLPARSCVLS